MKDIIFYQVSGSIFRNKGSVNDLIEIDEIFEAENPIQARKKAFDFYQNFIDVFLESKNFSINTNYEEQEIVLKDFFSSYQKEYFMLGDNIFDEKDVDSDKGIFIHLVKKNGLTHKRKNNEIIYEERLLIHCIDNQFRNLKNTVFNFLVQEYELYIINNFDIENFRLDIDTAIGFDAENIQSILRTPINFNTIF